MAACILRISSSRDFDVHWISSWDVYEKIKNVFQEVICGVIFIRNFINFIPSVLFSGILMSNPSILGGVQYLYVTLGQLRIGCDRFGW
jgi:hypothetical protein